MTSIVALDVPFPGAGRVLREFAKVSPNVKLEPLEQPWYSRERPDFAFLPAWHPNYIPFMQTNPKTKFCLVWTSPPLQSEMVPQELEYIRTILHLLDAGKIWGVWFGHEGWLPMVKKEGRRMFYAPYPVTLPATVKVRGGQYPVRNVSLFGPLHPRKNVLNQLIAAKIADVVVNVTDPDTLSDLLHLSGAKVVGHNWPPYELYERLLIERIDIGLQVSLRGAESFSYVCWDHVSRGIPCLTSVDWVPDELRVPDSSNPEGIAYQMRSAAVNDKDSGYWRRCAEEYAKRVNKECLETLNRELGLEL